MRANTTRHRLFGLFFAVLVGCEDQPDASSVLPTLPEWEGELSLTIGRDPGPGDEFIAPMVVGVDGSGAIYVFDQQLAELSRFDKAGRFLNIVAKRGKGPGEFQLPSSFGVESDSLWISENRLVRIHWYAPDGKPLRTVHTGWTSDRLGFSDLTAVGFLELGEWLLLGIEETEGRPAPSRPTLIWRYLKWTKEGETLDTLYAFRRASRTIRLHGGRTRIGHPGPEAYPIVSFRPRENRILRIERPVPDSPTKAEITLEWRSAAGGILRNRTLEVDPVGIPVEVRDSLWNRLVRSATLGGRIALDRATEKEMEQMAAWSDWYPPVGRSAIGPGGRIWLERLGASHRGKAEWLVVDSMFIPVARAYLPAGVTMFRFHRGQAWASLTDQSGIPVVVRIEFPGMPN